MKKIKPGDKQRILEWFEKHCYGFRNARKRSDILQFLRIPDRHFRIDKEYSSLKIRRRI